MKPTNRWRLVALSWSDKHYYMHLVRDCPGIRVELFQACSHPGPRMSRSWFQQGTYVRCYISVDLALTNFEFCCRHIFVKADSVRCKLAQTRVMADSESASTRICRLFKLWLSTSQCIVGGTLNRSTRSHSTRGPQTLQDRIKARSTRKLTEEGSEIHGQGRQPCISAADESSICGFLQARDGQLRPSSTPVFGTNFPRDTTSRDEETLTPSLSP